MPRIARNAAGGVIYHVINRGVGKMQIFFSEHDFVLFEDLIIETRKKLPMRIYGYCLMPNHWHLVLCPERDGDLAVFMHRLTMTHAHKWQWARGVTGSGHIYQDRFKSLPVTSDDHFYVLLRYIERNPLRANIIKSVEDWRWSSLWWRVHPDDPRGESLLTRLPDDLSLPPDWIRRVEEPLTEAELSAVRQSIRTSTPFGPALGTGTGTGVVPVPREAQKVL